MITMSEKLMELVESIDEDSLYSEPPGNQPSPSNMEEDGDGSKVRIKAKNPGILEVPEGKHFYNMPLSHYKELVKKHGLKPISRALVNLEVWNKKRSPELSKKAKSLAASLSAEKGEK